MVRGKKHLSCDSLPERLRKSRKEQGLSARSLSLKAGLSPNVVQTIEEGGRYPGVHTVEQLATALGVAKAWLAYGEGPQTREELTYWLAPDCDPLSMIEQLRTLVNGPGGHIEQSFKYLDAMDAANWRALIGQSRYAALVEGMPLAEVAEAVRHHIGRGGLDLVGLGVGTGRHELRLVSHLLDRGYTDIRLYLLDISQALLNIACRQARETLSAYSDIRLCAINGDFFHLPNYEHLFQTSHRRRRLWSMFGYTFGNLDNEVSFIRNSLTGSAPGDLLLIDVPLAQVSADREDEIRKRDPALAVKRVPEFQRQIQKQELFNVGPIRRYASDVADIEFGMQLDKSSCVVPGSYAIQLRASVAMLGGGSKSFSVGYVKRYEPRQLEAKMQQEGWEPMQSWSYGDGYAMVGLFRRGGAAEMGEGREEVAQSVKHRRR